MSKGRMELIKSTMAPVQRVYRAVLFILFFVPKEINIEERYAAFFKPSLRKKIPFWFRMLTFETLQWRHNDQDGVSNHQPRGLFTQPFIQTQIKENIKAPRHWPLCGELTGDRWIPRTKGQLRGKCFHLMTSSWQYMICFVLDINPIPRFQEKGR